MREPTGIHPGQLLKYSAEAMDPSVVQILRDDFIGVTYSATDNLTTWLTTLNGGTVAPVDSYGGKSSILITTHTNDHDIVNMQCVTEFVKPAAGKRHSFHLTNLRITDVSLTGLFAGLAVADTAIITTDAAMDNTDYIGFLWNGTTLYGVSGKNSHAATVTLLPIPVDATDIDLDFGFDGVDGIQFFVDGAYAGQIEETAATKTDYPDDEDLAPAIVVETLSEAAATAYLDLIEVYAERG